MYKKSFGYLFILLVVSSSCTSRIIQKIEQKKFERQKLKTAIISGKITNLSVYPHIKELKLVIPGFRGDDQLITQKIDSVGQFRFEFYPVVWREVSLANIEERFVIGPGDSLFIYKDFADIINTDFSGDNAQLNKEISLFRSEYLGRFSHAYDIPCLNYKAFCDSIKRVNNGKLNRFVEKHKPSKAFKAWARKQIDLDYARWMFNYPLQYRMRTREEMKDSSTYFSFTDNLAETYDNTLIMADYFKVAERYVVNEFNSAMRGDRNRRISDDDIFDIFSSRDTKEKYLNEFLLSYFVHSSLNSNTTRFYDKYSEKVDQQLADVFLRFSVLDRVERTREYLDHPERFTEKVLDSGYGKELNGRSINVEESEHNIVKRLISQYPGKVIYFDVWASGCAPCIRNMKFSGELEAQYRNRDMIFVYLSTDTQKDKWLSRVKELNLEGLHILCSREESRDLKDRFGFSGIPYYMLVNKSGAIVDYGHHLIPQSISTQEKISLLVDEEL
ncbi:TlpA family protein disulfide reductase [Saccharicrinis sp. FJH54]|uniref:TlpA family protein disulfide reductase n=1 Tax=Saccharicrinis sp. FJH54 TaxID=3344665 RepID=UPI0035D42626